MATDTVVTIAPEHPALPGHFPGDPLVPGVLLLGHVVAALEATLGPVRLDAVPQAKFLAPLRPGEPCSVRFVMLEDGSAQFECRKDDVVVARGTLRFARAV
jgi:3-hydroxymyristoyl/3-hydroxydecanoyl-(acyl carrier protein) dehydratase